jgi:hypothetical protein
MKELSLGFLFLASFFSSSTVARQANQATDPCQRARVQLSIAPDLKLKVVNHFLRFDPQVEGTLVLRNETGEQINGITILVNYTDQQGRRIFAIPYQASVKGSQNTTTNIRPFYRGRLTRPVKPGEVFNLAGTGLLTATTVPVKSEVSFISLQLADRGVERAGVGSFQSDPILEEAPREYFQLAASTDNLPQQVSLKVSIGASGTVKDVDFASESEPRDQLLTPVMDEIRRWRFFPAIRDGFGVPSHLFVLLRFRRADEPPVLDCFIGQGDKYPATFVIVRLEPVPTLKGRWMFFYDKYQVNGWNGPFLGQQESESTPWTIKDH